jgi:ferredoxin
MLDACTRCGECVDICPKVKTAAIMDMKSESTLAAKPNMLCHTLHTELVTLIAPTSLLSSLPLRFLDRLSLRFRRPQSSRIYNLRNNAIPVLLRGAHGDARMRF